MSERAKSRNKTRQQKSVVKGLSFMGPINGYPCKIDVSNGRLIRISPLNYGWKYDPKEFKP